MKYEVDEELIKALANSLKQQILTNVINAINDITRPLLNAIDSPQFCNAIKDKVKEPPKKKEPAKKPDDNKGK